MHAQSDSLHGELREACLGRRAEGTQAGALRSEVCDFRSGMATGPVSSERGGPSLQPLLGSGEGELNIVLATAC